MRAQEPTFWPLGGSPGWPTAAAQRVSAGAPTGLRLAAHPSGPLALSAPDGSLGRLTLPRGMALDGENTLYLLGLREPWIKRFDPSLRKFTVLPTLGGRGREPRQFRQPANIAIAGHNLYVADTGNRRVQVFDLPSLTLRHLWGPWDANRRPLHSPGGWEFRGAWRQAWKPVDVAAGAGAAFILDGRYGRVYRHRPGDDTLAPIIDERAAEHRWSKIALDRAGRIYLLDAQTATLAIYSADGQQIGQVRDVGEVRDRFDLPMVWLERRGHDDTGRFCLPARLTQQCDRAPGPLPPMQSTLATCQERGGLTFDRDGCPAEVDPTETYGAALYEMQGRWFSQALDSQIYRCQWHRIELEVGECPAGAQIEISTYAGDEPSMSIADLPDSMWDVTYGVVGEMQPPSSAGEYAAEEAPALSGAGQHEFLVRSRAGQRLWLRVELRGDGYGSPAIASMRVHYPRESYLGYLPAVYSADDESRSFLERFLSIFQTEWDDLERRIGEIAAYFDPRAVPEGSPMEYLAGWLALPLEGSWSGEQQRRLLEAASGVYRRRGTIESLRDYLRVYLRNISGVESMGERGYPQIVEGFRERQRLMLNQQRMAELGHGAPLWGPAQVGRLQLDVFAQTGDVRLVSTGDPERDLLHEYAHRFRVFVPAVWVRSADDERMLRRAIETEKPAHTGYDLCLVEPRFRVGLQSTVGVDTVIGAVPVARLACLHAADAPPSRAAHQRLGYDTVLGRRPADGPRVRLVPPGSRVGLDTQLT